jgi:VWFA-related protein
VFGGAEVPLDLVVLLDVSASVRDRLPLVRTAAKGFLKTLRAGDRGAVIGFNERVRVLSDWTDDQAALARAIDSANATGGTALYSAIYIALRGLGSTPLDATSVRRRAIVLLSDGEDTSSLLSYDDVLESCRRSGVIVYTIYVKRNIDKELDRILRDRRPRAEDGEYVLSSLARETGARVFPVMRYEELPGVYAQIAEELAHQYLLGYVPAPHAPTGHVATGPFHNISVAVPRHADAQARTRVGYLHTGCERKAATGTASEE